VLPSLLPSPFLSMDPSSLPLPLPSLLLILLELLTSPSVSLTKALSLLSLEPSLLVLMPQSADGLDLMAPLILLSPLALQHCDDHGLQLPSPCCRCHF
jgi:hypothetical protein